MRRLLLLVPLVALVANGCSAAWDVRFRLETDGTTSVRAELPPIGGPARSEAVPGTAEPRCEGVPGLPRPADRP